MSKHHCNECGQLSPWTPWSFCSQSCDGGERTRERTCQHAKKKDDGSHECDYSKIEIELEERPCATDPCRKLFFEI